MGLCASRALGVLGNLEECSREEKEEEEESSSTSSSLQMVSEASSARMSSCSNSVSRNASRNSTSASHLFKAGAALSFDSSRSSAEAGETGKLGALLCKRRPFTGNADILSAHLTNLLTSMLRSAAAAPKCPPEISFSSYLSTPFIRPQPPAATAAAAFIQRRQAAAAAMEAADEDDDENGDDEDDDGYGLLLVSAIAKSYAESAAKAAARDTFLFLEKNDRSLQSFRSSETEPSSSSGKKKKLLPSYVPEEEEDEITVAEEEEEEIGAVAGVWSSCSSEEACGTVELFRPGRTYYDPAEDEIVVAGSGSGFGSGSAAAAAECSSEQRSQLVEFCYPATTSRWASVVNAARQSASWLPRRSVPLEAAVAAAGAAAFESLKKKQGQARDVELLVHEAAAWKTTTTHGACEEEEEEGALSCSSSRGGGVGASEAPRQQRQEEEAAGEAATATSSSSSSPILGCVAACCSTRAAARDPQLRTASSSSQTGPAAAAAAAAGTPDFPGADRTGPNSGAASDPITCSSSLSSSLSKICKDSRIICNPELQTGAAAASDRSGSGGGSEAAARNRERLRSSESNSAEENLQDAAAAAAEDTQLGQNLRVQRKQGEHLAAATAADGESRGVCEYSASGMNHGGSSYMQSSQSNVDSKNPGWNPGCFTACLAAAGKLESHGDPSCSSSSSSRMCSHLPQYDQPQLQEEEEDHPDPDDPADPDHPDHLDDPADLGPDPDDREPPDSFFSFPSSPSSKLFEEMGSGHIIEQMKSAKLMQEMAYRKIAEIDNMCETVGFEGSAPRCHAESGTAHSSRDATLATRSQLEAANDSATQQIRAPPPPQQSSNLENKKLKFFSLERACNAAISKRFVVSESLASASREAAESSCESCGILHHQTQGARMMSFTGHSTKDFACLQMKKCVNANEMADMAPSGVTAAAASESGTLRNLIHGSKAVRKASARVKSRKDASKKQPKYVEQVEESTPTFSSPTGKGLVLLKLGLLRRKHLAVKNTADKSSVVSPTTNPSSSSTTVSISRSVDDENKPP